MTWARGARMGETVGMLPSVPEEPRPPALRASDDDRSQIVDVLRAACADGRITLDEFSDRVGQAYAARTVEELKPVTADLPMPVTPPGTLPAPTSNVGARQSRWVIGIM